ncbi:MAG TPA: hemolysin family protein [Candidatus Acidoferrum sp.]|nr:hemolysin family protein [Candidatus Acidoferrum sp.]
MSTTFAMIFLKILAVAVLVLLNAFFVAAELALVRIRDSQLTGLAIRGDRRAQAALHIIRHLDAYISATQFGITLVSIGLGVAVEPVFLGLLSPLFAVCNITSEGIRDDIALGVGFFVNCYLLIVAGELVPKAIAIRRTLATALWVASPLNWFYRVSFPFIWLLQQSSRRIVRQLGVDPDALSSGQSEEELRIVLAAAQGSSDRRNLILNALDLRHRTAREVMRPRNEITTLDSAAPIADCLSIAEKTRYSRFPICDGGDPDLARGVIHIKDLYALRDKAKTAADLLPYARKLICVPESARLENLLQRFLAKKTHFALVVDEYGGTLGVVTLENAMEALVGQIQDEYDSEKLELALTGDNVWEAAGGLPLHELEKIIGEVPHDESIATVSGWVTQNLGGFPKVGDIFQVNTFELHVEEMHGPRVARLKITRRSAPGNAATSGRPESRNPE